MAVLAIIFCLTLCPCVIFSSFYNIAVQVVFDTALYTVLSYHKRKLVATALWWCVGV